MTQNLLSKLEALYIGYGALQFEGSMETSLQMLARTLNHCDIADKMLFYIIHTFWGILQMTYTIQIYVQTESFLLFKFGALYIQHYQQTVKLLALTSQ